MDSSKVLQSYATSTTLSLGAQILVLKSDLVNYYNPVGKFSSVMVTPSKATDEAKDTTRPFASTSKVINASKNDLGITRITESNYVELTIPQHLFTIKEIKTTITTNVRTSDGYHVHCAPTAKHEIIYNDFVKEQKFLALNLTGNITKPVIVGVIE